MLNNVPGDEGSVDDGSVMDAGDDEHNDVYSPVTFPILFTKMIIKTVCTLCYFENVD